MSTTIRRSLAAVLAMAIITCAALVGGGGTAYAQCPNRTVVNNTGSTLDLVLQDANGVRAIFRIPGGGGPIVIGPFPAVGAVSAAGAFFPFNTPCITHNAPPPLPQVCAFVNYNPATCTITLLPCPAPCIP